jgi:hypothetical protein
MNNYTPIYGNTYRFIHQEEVLRYIGRDGCWLQFCLDESTDNEVWAEILDCDMWMLEEL